MTGGAELLGLCLPQKTAALAVGGPTKQGLNSLITLGLWILWKHRDDGFLMELQRGSPQPYSPLPC